MARRPEQCAEGRLFLGVLYPSADGISQSSSMQTTVTLRVTPEDGQPEFEPRLSAWGDDANRLQPGRWTYIYLTLTTRTDASSTRTPCPRSSNLSMTVSTE
jgi:hypothetical protein